MNLKKTLAPVEEYSEAFKRQVVSEYERGLFTKSYYSKEYTEIPKKSDILISMTENSDPYENAIAERVNGILKYEFGLIDTFEDFKNLSHSLTNQFIITTI